MKCVFLSNSIGGLMNFRREFIETLCAEGHEVHISSPLEISPEYFKSIGCHIHALNMRQRGTNPFTEFALLKKYEQLIKDISPDIVFAYTIKPNIYGSVASKKLGIPIIASVTGLGTAVENKGVLQKISVLLLKWGMSKASHVYFQNSESMDFFQRYHIRLKSQSLIAGSGVNLDKFCKSIYPEERNGVKFLFIGRILEAKGVRLYLEAAAILKEEFPTSQFHIVGIKDDLALSELVVKYDEKGIVIFHGPQNDVRPFIANAHCQVHPTFYPEGMSNVLLESAAMGRPAITTDKSGCKEIVEDGVTGFIIPQRSKEALINKMRQFINLKWEDKKQMGIKAREKVEREFDRQLVIREYTTKAEELTGQKYYL